MKALVSCKNGDIILQEVQIKLKAVRYSTADDRAFSCWKFRKQEINLFAVPGLHRHQMTSHVYESY